MSVCPWYRYSDKSCTSPSLETPTTDVVNKITCLGGREVYSRCRYYREDRKVKEGGYEEFGRPFLMVHGLDKPPETSCDFARIFKLEQGRYVAGCAILKRFLGVHEVGLCESHWEQCPYRKLGLRLITEI